MTTTETAGTQQPEKDLKRPPEGKLPIKLQQTTLFKPSFQHTLLYCASLFFFVFLAISWAVPAAYGGSQARGRTEAAAAGLHHSHSHARSKLRLWPTAQLTEWGQGLNLSPHGY